MIDIISDDSRIVPALKNVSQNVTLHHPNALNKTMDGLFKNIAPDFSGGHLETVNFGTHEH